MAGTDLSPAVARVARRVITGLPPGGVTPEFERFLSQSPPAGILLFRRDFGTVERLPDLVHRLRERAAPARLLVCVDEEGGFVSQITPDLPSAPSARVLGRAASEAEVHAIAEHLGRSLRRIGVDVDFAPVFDVDSEAANPVIGPRAFSRRADEVVWLALGFAQGLSRGGVLPCAKHFPGHGDTRIDSHLALPVSPASRALLEERDLPPFRAAVGAGLPMVMVAHVHYPVLDETERPATLSPLVVNDLLRGELGFSGVVVTDALEMKAIADRHSPGEAARAALVAGCDLLLYGAFTKEVESAIAELARDLEGGKLDPTALAAADYRLERLFQSLSPHHEDAPPAANLAALRQAPVDLVSLCRRALRWVNGSAKGEPPPISGEWLVVEPEWPAGPSLLTLLAEVGWSVAGRTWQTLSAKDLERPGPVLFAHARRVAPTHEESSWIAQTVAERPVLLVALGQDAFLADFPQALGRLSAGDPGEAMRRAVSSLLGQWARGKTAATGGPRST